MFISESISGRLAPQQEVDNLLSSGQIENEEQIEGSSDHDVETLSNNDKGSQISDDKRKSSGSKSNQTADSSQVQSSNRKSPCISPESDLVSSTNKEDDEIPPQPSQSQSTSEQKDSDPSYGTDDKSESTVYEESEVSHSENTDSKSEQTDDKSESTCISLEAFEEVNASSEQTNDDFDAEDSDNIRERRNPKTCVEREMPHQFEDGNKQKSFAPNYQRNRHTRPQMPRPNHPYGIPGGPDFNPSFMPQYRGARRPMLPISQSDFIRGHSMNMMRGPPNHMQRMPPGMPPHARMPGMLGPPHQRLQRPPFPLGPGMFGNNQGMPPQGKSIDKRLSRKNIDLNRLFRYF